MIKNIGTISSPKTTH